MVILSEEQENIYNNVSQGHNVVVDAVAGTGKTTLILSIAGRLPNKKILQITYNKSLRHEVMKRAIDMELENIKIHTFHSLAVKYYSREAHTDIELRKIINNKKKPGSRIDELDLLVLDECQDMTFLYFQLIVKFIMDMGHKIQLLILGDYMQGLYEFKGSDVRFLKLGDSLWKKLPNLRTNEFCKCTMKMSYRITNQMCLFINNALLGESRMAACRDGEPVFYIRNSIYNLIKIVYAEILKLFSQGVTPGEIFIIGASVKGDRSAIGKLENLLVERDIPCYVPMMEDEK
jgi:ATP-dependent exoDNAse (exonuclease V) beta subunit